MRGRPFSPRTRPVSTQSLMRGRASAGRARGRSASTSQFARAMAGFSAPAAAPGATRVRRSRRSSDHCGEHGAGGHPNPLRLGAWRVAIHDSNRERDQTELRVSISYGATRASLLVIESSRPSTGTKLMMAMTNSSAGSPPRTPARWSASGAARSSFEWTLHYPRRSPGHGASRGSVRPPEKSQSCCSPDAHFATASELQAGLMGFPTRHVIDSTAAGLANRRGRAIPRTSPSKTGMFLRVESAMPAPNRRKRSGILVAR